MHLWATNMPAKHSMITPSPSSPQVRLRPLTNPQGKPDTALYIDFAGRKHACPCMYFSVCGGVGCKRSCLRSSPLILE
jgi:hypothetical protein